MKSWFQVITLFTPSVPVWLLVSNGLRDITAPKKTNRKGKYIPYGRNPRGIKSSAQAGLWSGHQWRSAGSLQQRLTSLFLGYRWVVDPDLPRKPQLLHPSTFGACRRAGADLFVTCWRFNQQYQENKGSGTNQLHECLGDHRGLFCSDPSTNQDRYFCLHYCFGAEGKK